MSRRFAITRSLALSCFALAPLACAQSAADTGASGRADDDDVRAASRAFDHAQLVSDSAALAGLLADDLAYVRGSGTLASKREFLAMFVTPGFHLDPYTIVRPTFVRLGPQAAIVGGETTLSGTVSGARFTQHMRYSDTFLRRDGRWQVVHVQVTNVD